MIFKNDHILVGDNYGEYVYEVTDAVRVKNILKMANE
jgi:hypothetical protein